MEAIPDTLTSHALENSRETTRLTWARRAVQTGMLFVIGEFSFYGIFRCPFAVPYVSCVNCPVVQCPGRWMVYPFWIVLATSVLLFGRVFCGWACPGGFVSGLLSRLTRLGKKCKRQWDAKLQLMKYPVLLGCLFLWLVMTNPRWAIPIRTGEFMSSLQLTFTHANNLWLTRTISVLALIVIGGLLGNVWCRYLCPTGGGLEALKKIGLFQFRKSGDCNNCGKCRKVCDFNTEPESYSCTNCGECKNVCPTNAIYFGRPTKR